MYDVSILFIEMLHLQEVWNYYRTGEWEPISLVMENRFNMNMYEVGLGYKKFGRSR
jgi:hypothetical protein